MNRIIKFRVWDKKETKWLSLHNFIIRRNQLIVIINNEPILADNNFVLQQFTGLIDKNDREIYEGDILQNSYCKVKVFWNNKLSSFRAVVHYKDAELYYEGTTLDECIIRNGQVIGNIFNISEQEFYENDNKKAITMIKDFLKKL